ncbi:MAG: hypothetical protein AB7T32_10875 [Dehalococcoidia bacterium]
MKKTVLALTAAIATASALAINALAAPDDTISTTVTPVSIAIDILETGPLAYGNVPLGTAGAVPNPSNFTVQNSGSTNVDLKIAGFNTSGGWNLGSSQGADTYVQYYSTSGTPGSWTPLNLTGELFKQNLPPSGSNQQSVFVKLDMPTSTNNFNQQTMPIKVTAIAP